MGASFSFSKVRRFSSFMNVAMRTPINATAALVHQGRPRVPMERPADCKRPEKVGPNVLQRLAEAAIAPFKVPDTLGEGVLFAIMMSADGMVKACAHTFQTRIR